MLWNKKKGYSKIPLTINLVNTLNIKTHFFLKKKKGQVGSKNKSFKDKKGFKLKKSSLTNRVEPSF